MPFDTTIAGILAGIFSAAAYLRYIITVLRKETHPNRATWWIWTLVGFMLASSYFASGARDTMWVPLTYVIGPLVTASLSMKYGEGGWTPFDRNCLVVATLSAGVWVLTGSAMTALVTNLFVDAMGCLPTIKKAYRDPSGEDQVSWTLWFVGNMLNMFAVEEWSFELAGYPIYMFIGTGVITSVVLFRDRSNCSIK